MTFQTLKTLMTTFLVVMSSVLLLANDNQLSNVTVKAAHGRKVILSIDEMHSSAMVRLYNNNGELLTKVKAEAPTFIQQFDLSKLEAGIYRMTIEYGIREMALPITIKAHQSYPELGEREVNMKPIVRKANDQQVDLTFLNERIGTVLVEIVSPSGRVVFTDKLEHVLRVNKRYDLSKLYPDTYSFIVTTPKKTYTTELQNW